MEFVRGNKAIRDHIVDGKDLHLFKATEKDQPRRYHGQFVSAGWHEGEGKDRNGEDRKTIVFHLVPFEDVGSMAPVLPDDEDDDQSGNPARRREMLELERLELELRQMRAEISATEAEVVLKSREAVSDMTRSGIAGAKSVDQKVTDLARNGMLGRRKKCSTDI